MTLGESRAQTREYILIVFDNTFIETVLFTHFVIDVFNAIILLLSLDFYLTDSCFHWMHFINAIYQCNFSLLFSSISHTFTKKKLFPFVFITPFSKFVFCSICAFVFVLASHSLFLLVYEMIDLIRLCVLLPLSSNGDTLKTKTQKITRGNHKSNQPRCGKKCIFCNQLVSHLSFFEQNWL